jgi:hypothetical protein
VGPAWPESNELVDGAAVREVMHEHARGAANRSGFEIGVLALLAIAQLAWLGALAYMLLLVAL